MTQSKGVIRWIPNLPRQAILAVRIFFGRFRLSLARIVRGEVRKHLRANAAVRLNRYPLAKRLVRTCEEHPIGTLLILALAYALPFFLDYLGWLPTALRDPDPTTGFRDFAGINTAILGVQGALVGLVFPLVIAFVGLLNQGRASFASRLTIYIESSIAVFVGLSSLLLCMLLVGQLVLSSWLPEGPAIIVAVLNLIWFAVNLFALAYFVLHTIDFLHPAKRVPIIQQYVANVIWRRELFQIVRSNRWENAPAYGYLPKGDDVDQFTQGGQARVWYAYWNEGEPGITKHLTERKRLVDIHMGMLSPAVSAWLAAVRASGADQTHDLALILQPGREFEGDQVIARSTYPLPFLARWGIRRAYRFRAVRTDPADLSDTAAILREMIADLIALIDTRQAEEFGTQLRSVTDFHSFLYRLAQASDEDVSFAQLQAGVLGSTLGSGWIRAYRDLISRAVERVAEEPAFVASVAYLASNIHARLPANISSAALEPLQYLATSLPYRLMDWGLSEHRAESAGRAEQSRSFTLIRQADAYARAWQELVAGWEHILVQLVNIRGPRNRERAWAEFQQLTGNVVGHLHATTMMAGRAVWLGDKLATSWACDLLLHWDVQVDRYWGMRGRYWMLPFEKITLDALGQDWPTVWAQFADAADIDEAKPAAAFAGIMRNAWLDHLVTLASTCLHWAMYEDAGAAALRAARMLLRNEPHDRGDTGLGRNEPPSATELLISALRITGSGEPYSDGGYAARFEHLLENLGNLGESVRVSMRIYSSSGGFSFEALPTAHAIALMTADSRSVDSALRRMLTEGGDEVLQRREKYLEALLKAVGEIDNEKHGSLVAALADAEGPAFEARKEGTREFVRKALEVLQGFRSQAIIDAEIDPARLYAVAVSASSMAFTPGDFPLNLFATIEPAADTLETFTVTMKGQSKGAFTDPPMAQVVINEDDWWRDVMSRQVAHVVWRDVLHFATFQDVDGRSPDEFWSAVRDGSTRMRDAGQDPVLVVSSTSDPSWLLDWRWQSRANRTAKPADLVITFEPGQVEAYEFSMNGTPVYRGQTVYGAAYLVPRQLLQRVHYHDYGDGLSVSASFETDPEDPWRGTVHASFQREVDLAPGDIYRIRYADPIEIPAASGDNT